MWNIDELGLKSKVSDMEESKLMEQESKLMEQGAC
jgi:hypothetical protein